MANFICYDEDSGLIEHIRQSDIERLQFAARPDGHCFMEVGEDGDFDAIRSDHMAFYVDVSTLAILPRPEFDIPSELTLVLGAEPVSLPIPTGTTLAIDDREMVVEERELLLSADVDDTYLIRLTNWPFMPKTIQVTAHVA
jgi:hypothetical protein